MSNWLIIVNNTKDYARCISKPSFVSQKIFSKDFVATDEINPVLTLNKPIYVGFSILDLSKLLMYEFHYKYTGSRSDAKLLFTDTDSLVYEIRTEDVNENCYQDKNLFDFSDPVNKKVISKMKDESKGKIISDFAGLKSKMYSLIDVYDEEVTKAKGVNKKIKHKEFVDVLFNKKMIRHNMKRIQSKFHKTGTYNVCKI